MYLGIPVLVVAVVLIAIKLVLPGVLKSAVLKAIDDACADCSVQIGSIEVGLLPPGRFVVHDIRFQAGQGGRSMAEGRIAALRARLKWSESNRHKLTFESLEGDGVDVTYSEGEAKKIDLPAKPAHEHPMDLVILKTTFAKAEFRYAHTWNGRTSILHIHDIEANVSAIGTTADVQNQMSEARLTGRIERSGHGELTLAALTRSGARYVDVRLLLEDQNLEDANRFFAKNDGLELHGLLKKALATVHVRDRKSQTKVQAIYRDIDFKQSPTPQTGELEAFITNLGASLFVTKTNVDFLPADQTAEGDVKREDGEALVHFILRSMKEQLMEVAKKRDSRTARRQASLEPIGKE